MPRNGVVRITDCQDNCNLFTMNIKQENNNNRSINNITTLVR